MALAWPGTESFGPVHFLPGENRGKYPSGNVVFVAGGVPTVIDPMCRAACGAIADAVQVQQLFNSHFHEDHRSGNDLFPDAALCVPELEREGYSDAEGFAAMYGATVEDVERWIGHFPGVARMDVAGTFAHGDVLQWGDVRVEIVGLPGHSPGQSGFFFPEQRVMFVADVDFSKFGPWYGGANSDIDAFIETLTGLATYVPRVDALLTSHDRGVVRGDLAREVALYRGIIRARDHRLLAYLEGGARTWDEIVKQEIVYFYPAKERGWVQHDDGMMIRKHLDRLVAAGMVVVDGEHFVLVRGAAAPVE